ncbi:MAG: hypothetical protein INR69_03950 [Mucilaginibacter polytrichastri]|nr:hypothetical protein [Mucilaginibacter polytrichastri]
MKNLIPVFLLLIGTPVFAQKTVKVKTVLAAEEEAGNYVKREGLNKGLLKAMDGESIVFEPKPVNAREFYATKSEDKGKLTWKPIFARVSRNGDMGFTTGPYEYTDADGEKKNGEYVSVWKEDAGKKLRLFTTLRIAHSPVDQALIQDYRDPANGPVKFESTDPFSGKSMILANDKTFNSTLSLNVPAAFKEFYSAQGRLLFPTYAPITGEANLNFFLRNNKIAIKAEPIGAGRAASNDLAYSYGRATVVYNKNPQNFYYLRVWEIDEKHRWNIVTEIYTPETGEFKLNNSDDNAQLSDGDSAAVDTVAIPKDNVKVKKAKRRKKSDDSE